jgi:glycyl-tRNA synthetase
MVTMLEFYDEEVTNKEDGTTDTRVVIRFPFQLAPVKYAIMPLLEKNEEMVQLGQTIYNSLKSFHKCELDIS